MALVEEFRFHSPQINMFYDAKGVLICEYPLPEIFSVNIDEIQSSQFFIDELKLEAVASFFCRAEDIVIQVFPWNGRYISIDGHTRLFYAVFNGYETVKSILSDTDDYIWKFVEESKMRGVYAPHDMKLLSHEKYKTEWEEFCDSVFAEMENNK